VQKFRFCNSINTVQRPLSLARGCHAAPRAPFNVTTSKRAHKPKNVALPRYSVNMPKSIPASEVSWIFLSAWHLALACQTPIVWYHQTRKQWQVTRHILNTEDSGICWIARTELTHLRGHGFLGTSSWKYWPFHRKHWEHTMMTHIQHDDILTSQNKALRRRRAESTDCSRGSSDESCTPCDGRSPSEPTAATQQQQHPW